MEHLLAHAESNEEPQEEVTLESIMAYANAFDEKEAEVKKLEEELKEKKSAMNKIGQVLLPQAMAQVGMKSVEIANGAKITVKEDVSCTVVDIHKLYDWMDERGDSGLVKTSIITDKLPKNILESICNLIEKTYGVPAEGGLTIHPQTMNAYFRKLLGLGAADAELTVGDIDEEMVSVYTYYKVKLKR